MLMPLYQSHKKVRALKIAHVDHLVSDPHAPMALKVDVSFEDYQNFPARTFTLMGKPTPEPGWYLVEYEDGYVSFSPGTTFEKGHKRIEEGARESISELHPVGIVEQLHDFGWALNQLWNGERVCRQGWNGKGMWLALSPGNDALPADKFWAGPNRQFAIENGGAAKVLPSITMKTASGEILMGWLASQTDMLTKDWCFPS
jgi:Protein of unknown function (DUF2829)